MYDQTPIIKQRLSVHHPDAMIQLLIANSAPMPASLNPKSERIDVRASTPVKQLLQEAARVSHKNVSEFLLDAGINAANQALADRTKFDLSKETWTAFQKALDQPVKPKPKLKKLLSDKGLLG
jgi:uncharacterized protein (DUF1778 family)